MIHPIHAPIPGHLPPVSWFLNHRDVSTVASDGVDANDANGQSAESDTTLLNFQRLSSVTTCLLRSTSDRIGLDIATDGNSDAGGDTDEQGHQSVSGSFLAENRRRLVLDTLRSQ
jgi:hypothetical protein